MEPGVIVKSLLINLPFNGDIATKSVRRSLCATVEVTFKAAAVRCQLSTASVIICENKDELLLLSFSMIVYQFRCTMEPFR